MAEFPTGQMAMFDLAKADRYRADAEKWVSANVEAWFWMQNKAREFARKRKRFSIDLLVTIARYEMDTEWSGRFKINNNIRAPLARMLREIVPTCAPYLEVRDSVCDL